MISISLRLHRIRSPESLASGRCTKDGRVAQGKAVRFANHRKKSGVFQNPLEKNMQKWNATKRNSSLKEIWETWHFDVSSCPGLRCFWWYLRGGDELTSGSPCILRGRTFWEDMPSGGEVSDASQDGKWDKRWYRWYRCKPCNFFFKQCSLLTQASNSLYDPDAKRREEELEKRQKEEEARNFLIQMECAK